MSSSSSIEITKRITYSKENLWKDYGVIYENLTYDAQQYFLYEVLRRCSLYVPQEVEDSVAIASATINIRPLTVVSSHREVVGTKYKFPLTLTLLSCKAEFVGIKTVVYNYEEMKESGVFFMVNSEEWEDLEEKKIVPKKKENLKDELPDSTLLPESLKKKGYKMIRDRLNIVYDDKMIPKIQYESTKGFAYIEQLENFFTNKKKRK